ncbi:hypothetical protein OG539_32660 [Actinacidiphila glaucinigra]|uniref:hypothetical protein n=1 Tax=Actinacidiphila glaucinigra TaxID=235986 RepID=UPI003251E1CF
MTTDRDARKDQAMNTEIAPPGGFTLRVCRGCWTGIQWVDGHWTHVEGASYRDKTHVATPPPLPATDAPLVVIAAGPKTQRCSQCGRSGTRGFRVLANDEHHIRITVCANKTACRKRWPKPATPDA